MSARNETDRATIRWTLVATSFGFALVQLDVTIVNVALPRIGTELSTDVAGLQWVVDAYALVFAAFLLTAGFLGDRYGARRVYLGGLGLFAAASLACGFALDASTLVAARAIQGLGATAMLPASLTLLNHASQHDAKLRAWAIGWWTAAGSVAIAAGPIVGGLILGVTSWRAIFLVNLPVCALGAYLTLRVPETDRDGRSKGFDPLGQILAVVALGLLTASVIEARPLGPTHPAVVGGLLIAIAAAIGFVAAEAKARTPMLPLDLFKAPGFGACIIVGIILNFTFYGIVFLLTLYLQKGLGYGAVATGFAYLPLTATLFVVNVGSGMVVGRLGARLPLICGAVIDAIGFALLLQLSSHSTYVAMLPAFALMAAGMGTAVPPMTTAILAVTRKELSGTASALLNAARQAGGAMGVAAFGALGGDAPAYVVEGLHASAVVAVAMLLAAAALAAGAVPQKARG